MRNVYKVLVRKPEQKRPLRYPKRRWKDNIKLDLKETGWKTVDWNHLPQDCSHLPDLMKRAKKFRVPYKLRNFLTTCDYQLLNKAPLHGISYTVSQSVCKRIYVETLNNLRESEGEMRNTYKVLVGKPEGKRPLGSLRRG
jgi:hypothetical protein